MDLPIIVYLSYNQWNKEMIYDTSRYMFLIVRFYQRNVRLLLYGFHFIFYFNNIFIGEMVSWCNSAGDRTSMEHIHYRNEEIFMTMVMMIWKCNCRVFSRPGGGGGWMIKPQKGMICDPYRSGSPKRGIVLAGEEGETWRRENFNAKKPL